MLLLKYFFLYYREDLCLELSPSRWAPLMMEEEGQKRAKFMEQYTAIIVIITDDND